MNRNGSRKARLDAARDVADGREPAATDGKSTDRFHDNLYSIAQLSRAFASAGPSAEPNTETFTWGHLEVRDLIGRGSFGSVYRALDTVLHREVALKLRDSDSPTASNMESRAYIQEARRLARVRHPNVLAVHGADVFNDRVGIWTDLLRGETLGHALQHDGGPDTDRILEIGCDLAHALEAIHREGVVHGDLKPGNIMLEPDGRVVLMDFGAGNLESDETGRLRFGTPAVMAPESLERGEMGAAGDLYALGAVLYRMLTGQYPGGTGGAETLARRQAGGFTPVTTGRGRVPGGLASLVRRLLDPDPGKRPRATEVLTAIQHIREAPARRRRRLTLAAVMGSLALGVLVATLGYFQARQSQLKAQEAQTRAESINRLLLGMMEQVAPLKSPGGTIEARSLLEAGRTQVGQLSGIGPRNRANLLLTLADLYTDFEIEDQADELSSSALEASREAHGMNSPEANQAARTRANALVFLGKHDQALALLDSMLGDDRGVTGLDRARLLRQRGLVTTRLERFDEARANFEAAMALADSSDDTPTMLRVRILQGLSFLDHYAGRYEPAKSRLERAITLLEGKDLPNERFHLAALLKARARLARDADGDLERQLSLQRRALDIYHELYDRPTKSVATAEYELGAALYQQERYTDALPYFQRALDIYRTGGHVEGEATTALMLAKSHKALEQYEETRRYLEITERNYRQVYGDSHSYMAMLLNERARLELDDGNPSRARDFAADALRIYQATMGEGHPVTATANKALGRAMLAMGELAGARKHLEHTLDIWLDQFGEQDWRVADARYWLGSLYSRLDDVPAARQQLEMALDFYAAEPDQHPESLSRTRHMLAGLPTN